MFCASGDCDCAGPSCTVETVGGWANFTGLAVDSLGLAYALRAEAVVGREPLGDLCIVCNTTAPFDAFAPSAVQYIRTAGTARAGCPLRPAPQMQMLGYSLDLVLRPIPVSGSAFVNLMPCQGACDATVGGSSRILFHGGIIEFSDVWLIGAGQFTLRFVAQMIGSVSFLDPPYPDMSVAVNDSVTGVRVVQNPFACGLASLLYTPAQVAISFASADPSYFWTCKQNYCLNNKLNLNLTASVMQKESSQEISFPSRILTILNSTRAEFNFYLNMPASGLYVRFILYFLSCSGSSTELMVVNTDPFSFTGLEPAALQLDLLNSSQSAVHDIAKKLTVSVFVLDTSGTLVYCPIYFNFSIISAQFISNNATTAEIAGYFSNCLIQTGCYRIGGNFSSGGESVMTFMVSESGQYKILVFSDAVNLHIVSKDVTFEPDRNDIVPLLIFLTQPPSIVEAGNFFDPAIRLGIIDQYGNLVHFLLSISLVTCSRRIEDRFCLERNAQTQNVLSESGEMTVNHTEYFINETNSDQACVVTKVIEFRTTFTLGSRKWSLQNTSSPFTLEPSTISKVFVEVEPSMTIAHQIIAPAPTVRFVDEYNNSVCSADLVFSCLVLVNSSSSRCLNTEVNSTVENGLGIFHHFAPSLKGWFRLLFFTEDGISVLSDRFDVINGRPTLITLLQSPYDSVSEEILISSAIELDHLCETCVPFKTIAIQALDDSGNFVPDSDIEVEAVQRIEPNATLSNHERIAISLSGITKALTDLNGIAVFSDLSITSLSELDFVTCFLRFICNGNISKTSSDFNVHIVAHVVLKLRSSVQNTSFLPIPFNLTYALTDRSGSLINLSSRVVTLAVDSVPSTCTYKSKAEIICPGQNIKNCLRTAASQGIASFELLQTVNTMLNTLIIVNATVSRVVLAESQILQIFSDQPNRIIFLVPCSLESSKLNVNIFAGQSFTVNFVFVDHRNNTVLLSNVQDMLEINLKNSSSLLFNSSLQYYLDSQSFLFSAVLLEAGLHLVEFSAAGVKNVLAVIVTPGSLSKIIPSSRFQTCLHGHLLVPAPYVQLVDSWSNTITSPSFLVSLSSHDQRDNISGYNATLCSVESTDGVAIFSHIFFLLPGSYILIFHAEDKTANLSIEVYPDFELTFPISVQNKTFIAGQQILNRSIETFLSPRHSSCPLNTCCFSDSNSSFYILENISVHLTAGTSGAELRSFPPNQSIILLPFDDNRAYRGFAAFSDLSITLVGMYHLEMNVSFYFPGISDQISVSNAIILSIAPSELDSLSLVSFNWSGQSNFVDVDSYISGKAPDLLFDPERSASPIFSVYLKAQDKYGNGIGNVVVENEYCECSFSQLDCACGESISNISAVRLNGKIMLIAVSESVLSVGVVSFQNITISGIITDNTRQYLRFSARKNESAETTLFVDFLSLNVSNLNIHTNNYSDAPCKDQVLQAGVVLSLTSIQILMVDSSDRLVSIDPATPIIAYLESNTDSEICVCNPSVQSYRCMLCGVHYRLGIMAVKGVAQLSNFSLTRAGQNLRLKFEYVHLSTYLNISFDVVAGEPTSIEIIVQPIDVDIYTKFGSHPQAQILDNFTNLVQGQNIEVHVVLQPIDPSNFSTTALQCCDVCARSKSCLVHTTTGILTFASIQVIEPVGWTTLHFSLWQTLPRNKSLCEAEADLHSRNHTAEPPSSVSKPFLVTEGRLFSMDLFENVWKIQSANKSIVTGSNKSLVVGAYDFYGNPIKFDESGCSRYISMREGIIQLAFSARPENGFYVGMWISFSESLTYTSKQMFQILRYVGYNRTAYWNSTEPGIIGVSSSPPCYRLSYAVLATISRTNGNDSVISCKSSLLSLKTSDIGASLMGTTIALIFDGTALFPDLRIVTAGNFQLVFLAGLNVSTSSADFEVRAADLDHLYVINSTSAQSADVDNLSTVKIALLDLFGNLLIDSSAITYAVILNETLKKGADLALKRMKSIALLGQTSEHAVCGFCTFDDLRLSDALAGSYRLRFYSFQTSTDIVIQIVPGIAYTMPIFNQPTTFSLSSQGNGTFPFVINLGLLDKSGNWISAFLFASLQQNGYSCAPDEACDAKLFGSLCCASDCVSCDCSKYRESSEVYSFTNLQIISPGNEYVLKFIAYAPLISHGMIVGASQSILLVNYSIPFDVLPANSPELESILPIISFRIDAGQNFYAGEVVLPPPKIVFLDSSNKIVSTDSGPWYVFFRFHDSGSDLCSSFPCQDDVICLHASNQSHLCGPSLELTSSGTLSLQISAPLRAGTMQTLTVLLINWDSWEVCKIKGEFFSFQASSFPLLVSPGHPVALDRFDNVQSVFAGQSFVVKVRVLDKFANEIQHGRISAYPVLSTSYINASASNTLSELIHSSSRTMFSSDIAESSEFDAMYFARIKMNISLADDFVLRIEFQSSDHAFNSSELVLWSSGIQVIASEISQLSLSTLPYNITAGAIIGLTIELQDRFRNIAQNFSTYLRVLVYLNEDIGLLSNLSVTESSQLFSNGISILHIPAPRKAGLSVNFNVSVSEFRISATTNRAVVIPSSELVLYVQKQPANSFVPGLLAKQPIVLVRDIFGNLPISDIYVYPLLISCSNGFDKSNCSASCEKCIAHKNTSSDFTSCPGACVLVRDGVAAFTDLYIVTTEHPIDQTSLYFLRISAAIFNGAEFCVVQAIYTVGFGLQKVSALRMDVEPSVSIVGGAISPAPSVWIFCNNNCLCTTEEYPAMNISVCLLGTSVLSPSSQTSSEVSRGIANFTDLVPLVPADRVKILFFLLGTSFEVASNFFSIKPKGFVSLKVDVSGYVVAGTLFSIQVTVLSFDANATEDKCKISVGFASSCSACNTSLLTGASLSTVVNGLANFDGVGLYPHKVSSLQLNVFALNNCLSNPVQFSIQVINAALQSLLYSRQPGNGVNGSPLSIQPILQMFDQYGNSVLVFGVPPTISYSVHNRSNTKCQALNASSDVYPYIFDGSIFFTNVTVWNNEPSDSANCTHGIVLTIVVNKTRANSQPFSVVVFTSLEVVSPNLETLNLFYAGIGVAFSVRMTDSNAFTAESNVHFVRVDIKRCSAGLDAPFIFSALSGFFNFSLTLESNACYVQSSFVSEYCADCIFVFTATASPVFGVQTSNGSYISGFLNFAHNISVKGSGLFRVIPGPPNEMKFQVEPMSSICGGNTFMNSPTILIRNSEGLLDSSLNLLLFEIKQGIYLGEPTNASFRSNGRLVSTLEQETSSVVVEPLFFDISHPGDAFELCVTRCPRNSVFVKNGTETCCKSGLPSNQSAVYPLSISCKLFGIFSTVCSNQFTVYNQHPAVRSLLLMHEYNNPTIAGEGLNISFRLLDEDLNALASFSYDVRAYLFDSFGNNRTELLLGRTLQSTLASFESVVGGSVRFTDLSITSAGSNYSIYFGVSSSTCNIVQNSSKLFNLQTLPLDGSRRKTYGLTILPGKADHLVVVNQPSQTVVANTLMTGQGGDISIAVVDMYNNVVSCHSEASDYPSSEFCKCQTIMWNVTLEPPCVQSDDSNRCSICGYPPPGEFELTGALSLNGGSIAFFKNLSVFSKIAGFGARLNFTASIIPTRNGSQICGSEPIVLMTQSYLFNISVSSDDFGTQSPVAVSVLQQPPPKDNFAGLPLIVQPIIALVDDIGEIITSNTVFNVTASICTLDSGLTGLFADYECSRFPVSNTVHDSKRELCKVKDCSSNASLIQGNSAQFQGGSFQFPSLVIFAVQKSVVIMFVVSYFDSSSVIQHLINFSQAIEVQPCGPYLSQLSPATPIRSVADTGGGLCEGGTCVINIYDAFANQVNASLIVSASLQWAENVELAGFGVQASCRCSGVRNNTISGLTLDYGLSCYPWDNDEQTCRLMWQNCSVGTWCCKSWCFVDSDVCEDAIEHPAFPGLYVSYSACSDDQGSLMRCFWNTTGNCHKSNEEGSNQTSSALYGTSVIESQVGKFSFTDLLVIVPGIYILTFTAKYGPKVLQYSSANVGVTPLAARKLILIQQPEGIQSIESGKITVTLLQQPTVMLIDAYHNKVQFNKICLAVTATISSNTGLLYGQSKGDPNFYFLEDTQDYIITANAQNGVAAFTAMTVEPKAKYLKNLIINFTTGCCRPQPSNCFCSNPINPFVKDLAQVLEPCVWTAGKLTILGFVDALVIDRVIYDSNLTAGDSLDFSLSLLSNETVLIDPAETYHVSATLKEMNADTQIALMGTTRLVSMSGLVHFTDLHVTFLQGLSHVTLILHFEIEENPEISADSELLTISARAPSYMNFKRAHTTITVNDPIFAQLVFRDSYENPCSQSGLPVRMSLIASYPANGAAQNSEPLVGNTVVLSNGTGAYFGVSLVSDARIIVSGIHTLRFSFETLSTYLNVTVNPGEPAIDSANWIRGADQLLIICAWEPINADLQILDQDQNAANLGSQWTLILEIVSASLSSTLMGMLKCTAESSGVDYIFGSDLCTVFTLGPTSTGEVATVSLMLFDLSFSQLVPKAVKTFGAMIMPPALNLTLELCTTSSRLIHPIDLACERHIAQISCDCKISNNNQCSCTNQTANESFVHVPRLHLVHKDGSPAVKSSLVITAALSGSACYHLIGVTSVQAFNGTATFTNLGIADTGCQDTDRRVRIFFSASHLSSGSSQYVTINTSNYELLITIGSPPAFLTLNNIPDVIAGMPFDPPIEATLICEHCLEPLVRSSSRTVRLTVQSTEESNFDYLRSVRGATEVDTSSGSAIFSDLVFTRAGTYSVRLSSVSLGFWLNSSTSNLFKVIPSDAFAMRIMHQPTTFAGAGEPVQAVVQFVDIFNNTKLDNSEIIISSKIQSNQPCSSSKMQFGCGCDDVSSSILEFGSADFKCLSIGQVGQNFTILFIANEFTVLSRPFAVVPGRLSKLIIIRQPSSYTAGNISGPIIVQFQDKCNNRILDNSYDSIITVIAVPKEAGLIGTSMVRSIDGQAVFSDLSFTSANDYLLTKGPQYHLMFAMDGLSVMSIPIIVTNAEIFSFKIIDQPVETMQGRAMIPFPKVILTDFYGNLAISGSSGMSKIVVSLTQDTYSHNNSCSFFCDGSIIDGVCFKFFGVDGSWSDGKELCESWGGHLAEIWSPQEIVFAMELTGGTEAWIGLNFGPYGDSYAWSWDGSDERLDLQSQEWIERNLLDSSIGLQNCIALGRSSDAENFLALDCRLTLPVICSKQFADTFRISEECYSCQTILGTNTAAPENGTATFTDIRMYSGEGINYRLHFVLERFSAAVVGNYLTDQNKPDSEDTTQSKSFFLSQGSALSQTFTIKPSLSALSIYAQPGECVNKQAFKRQPVLELQDYLGLRIFIDGVFVSAKISTSSSSAVLEGNTTSISSQGLIFFTDLGIKFPSLFQETFTLRFDAAYGGSSFLVFSQPFAVFSPAAYLLFLDEGTCRGFEKTPCIVSAGETIKLTLQMNDNFHELVDYCSAIVTVSIHGLPQVALINPQNARCNLGVASFDALQVTTAADSVFLSFFISSLGLSLYTKNFTVTHGNFSKLEFSIQPADTVAGMPLNDVLVSATDTWGNMVKQSDIQIYILILGNCISVAENTTINGQATFKNITFYIIGNYRLVAVLSDGCNLENSEKLKTTLNATSSYFRLLPSSPASISVLQNINKENVAGNIFKTQPSCIVKDVYGNNVASGFQVNITIADQSGTGCVCDRAAGQQKSQLCSPSRTSSVLMVNATSDPPFVLTTDGVAAFNNLMCTRRTCPVFGSTPCNSSYTFTCEVVGGSCMPCSATGSTFQILASEVSGLVVGEIGLAVAGRRWKNDLSAGFYAVSMQNMLSRSFAETTLSNLVQTPPYFVVVDRFGNLNESAQGPASVRISQNLKLEGYSYCVDIFSNDGTLCLGGTTNISIENGTAIFTDLSVLHSGPQYQLQFRFGSVLQDSLFFDVLPPSPKATGAVIGADFASIMLLLDRNYVAQNRFFGPGQIHLLRPILTVCVLALTAFTCLCCLAGYLDCLTLFSFETYSLLGQHPKCQLARSNALLVEFGASFSIRLNDFIAFEPYISLVSTEHWEINHQTGLYSQENPPSFSIQNHTTLDSLPAEDACLTLMLPEVFQKVPDLEIFDSRSVADIEFMSIGGDTYCFIAYFCAGRFCLIDSSTELESNMELQSPLYKWSSDDRLEFVQGIPTYGAKVARAFTLEDAGAIGPSSLVTCLAIGNFYSSVTIWWWNGASSQFVQRQSMDAVFVTSIDVFAHQGDTYIVIANTDPLSALTVSQWIAGEYTLDENGAFRWIDGHFSEPIQTIPTNTISSCKLYSVPSDSRMFLGITSSHGPKVDSSSQVPLVIMEWIPGGCRSSIGCFKTAMSLPAVGAVAFDSFCISNSFDCFIVIANYFEGQTATVVNSNFETLSFIYNVSYSTNTFSLLQNIPTYGPLSVLTFRFEGAIYIAFGNQRGQEGLNIPVSIYKFVGSLGSCSNSSKAGLPFQYSAEIPGNGVVVLKFISKAEGSFLVLGEGAGLKSASFFKIVWSAPLPIPIISTPTAFGSCVGLIFDGRGSLNSASVPFSVKWELSSFSPAPVPPESEIVVTSIVVEKIDEKLSSVHTLYVDVPIQYDFCLGIESNSLCMDELFYPYGQYAVSLNLTNWLGASQSTTQFFTKVDRRPRIFISGTSIIQTKKPNDIQLLLDIAPSCEDPQLSGLSIDWQIAPFVTIRQSISNMFVIPGFSLHYGTIYNVTVTVTTAFDLPVRSAVTIEVGKSNPVASLSGGDRIIPLLSGGKMKIDASSSYDPDSPGDNSQLVFTWACQQYRYIGAVNIGNYPFNCSLISDNYNQTSNSIMTIDKARLVSYMKSTSPIPDVPIYTAGCNASSDPNSEVQLVLGVGLVSCDPRATFTFRVTVCVDFPACPNGACCDNSQVTWSTSAVEIPVVQISAMQSSRISGSFDVAFTGTISSSMHNLVYRAWFQMLWNGIEYVPVSMNRTYVLSDSSSMNLVLSSQYFIYSGTYVFRLYATSHVDEYLSQFSGCFACGWSDVSVTLNSKPMGGRLVVSPFEGIAYQTIFSFSAQEWYDPPLSQDIYPLYYTFGFKNGDGSIRYIAVDITEPFTESALPFGFIQCSNCTSPDCTCLQAILQVRDSLNAKGGLNSPMEIFVEYPTNLSLSLATLSYGLKSSLSTKSPLNALTIISLQFTLLNDLRLGWTKQGISEAQKSDYRSSSIQILAQIAEDQAYLNQGISAFLSNILSLASGIQAELSAESLDLIRQVFDTIGSNMLVLLQSGDQILLLSSFIADAGSVLSNLLSSYSSMTSNSTRRSSTEISNVYSLITSVNTFAVLGAQGNSFVPGILPIVQDQVNFITKIYAVAGADIPGFLADVQVGSFYNFSSIDSPRTYPTATILLPSVFAGITSSLYALQLTLLYENPFPLNLQCLDTQQRSLHYFPEVLLPVNNAGTVQFATIRKPVTVYGYRVCSTVGKLVIANFRVGQSSNDVQLSSDVRIRLKLPFDSKEFPQDATSDTVDGLTGKQLQMSCLRWDTVQQSWSAEGISRIDISLGNSSAAPFIECEVNSLGIFIASEVPAGCDGVPLSPAVFDECGICGGDNQLCSGCDGVPNSGRLKTCSGHGNCSGQSCKCDPEFAGVVCQIYCDSAVNCSGHGLCDISYQNLEMNASVSCSCQSGYTSYSQDLDHKVGCMAVMETSQKIPKWAVITMSVLAAAFVFIVLIIGLLRLVSSEYFFDKCGHI